MTLLRTVKYQIQVYKNNEDMRKKGNTTFYKAGAAHKNGLILNS